MVVLVPETELGKTKEEKTVTGETLLRENSEKNESNGNAKEQKEKTKEDLEVKPKGSDQKEKIKEDLKKKIKEDLKEKIEEIKEEMKEIQEMTKEMKAIQETKEEVKEGNTGTEKTTKIRGQSKEEAPEGKKTVLPKNEVPVTFTKNVPRTTTVRLPVLRFSLTLFPILFSRFSSRISARELRRAGASIADERYE